MRRIQTKLVLAVLAIALLPVYPVYLLVNNLIERSREVGYNEKVEKALDSATEISRELFRKYKQETLAVATELSQISGISNLRGQTKSSLVRTKLTSLESARLSIYNDDLKLLWADSTDANASFPVVYLNILNQVKAKNKPELIEGASGNDFIFASAPIGNQKFLLLTRRVREAFSDGGDRIVEVNQMFKTLDFLENELQQSFLLSFFVIYVPIAIFSVFVAIYFSKRVTSPLLNLVKGTKEVAEGDWNYRIEVTSKDEVGQLSNAFNQMVATLKEKQEQVIGLEKMAAWREIARVLAHEIKNPLTPIQLMVQQIKDKYHGGDDEYQKLLDESADIVNDEIEALRTLVREFSEFARMPELHFETGDLNVLIEDVCRIYPGDIIELKLDPSLKELSFDHEKMRRVLINLIENSRDSIREKGSGKISIATGVQSQFAIIDYADTGNGIPREIQDKIFEPYFSTKKSGMGLGMAIVKRIIVEHGGRIEMSSEIGSGSTFQMFLPLQQSELSGIKTSE